MLARGPAPLIIPGDPVEVAGGVAIEVAIGVRLDLVGDDPKQERARQMSRRRVPEHIAPADAKPVKVQALQRCKESANLLTRFALLLGTSRGRRRPLPHRYK